MLGASNASRKAALVMMSASGDTAAISRATSNASSISVCELSDIRLTRLRCSASLAVMVRPVKAISLAT